MGKDKSLLDYHGKAQCYHVYELLQNFCSETFISCNRAQKALIDKKYNSLEDLSIYADTGPAAALLTAFSHHPSKGFLVIGCDYPFLSKEEIGSFLSNISRSAMAWAFYDEANQCYQPVLAWYAPGSAPLIQDMFQNKQGSLQQFLKKIDAGRYYPVSKASMLSVDAREEREEAIRILTNDNHKRKWKTA